MKVNITIPTYNRAHCIVKAVTAALNQTYHELTVTVVDDGSDDNTYEKLTPFMDDPRFCYIRLAQNAGTAQAKNVSLLLSDYDAITFHDSDDVPGENKVLMQVRAMEQPSHNADPILNWEPMGYAENESLAISVVVGAHRIIKLDGSVHTISKRMSLVDDFFPNLQFPSKTEGDWILINSGLFRKSVFEEIGGYMDSVEEDREIRNRTIGCGFLYFYLEEPLLTKIEMCESLTVSESTGYQASRRIRDREEVWKRVKTIRQHTDIDTLKKEMTVPVDLKDIRIDLISNPEILTINESVPFLSLPEKTRNLNGKILA